VVTVYLQVEYLKTVRFREKVTKEVEWSTNVMSMEQSELLCFAEMEPGLRVTGQRVTGSAIWSGSGRVTGQSPDPAF